MSTFYSDLAKEIEDEDTPTEKPAYKLDPEFVDESKRRPNSSTPKRTVRFLDDVGKEHQEVSGDRQFGDSSGF
ncbi:unnamed protein product, partial [Schistosoma mattheei]